MIKDQFFKKCVWCGITLNDNNREPKNRQYCRYCAYELRKGIYNDYKVGANRSVLRK